MLQRTLRTDLASPAAGLRYTSITGSDADELVREVLIRPRHLDLDVQPVDPPERGNSTTSPRRPFPRVQS